MSTLYLFLIGSVNVFIKQSSQQYFFNGVLITRFIFKDAGLVHESLRNESNLLRFLVLRNESTKRIFGKQAYETNPRYESLEVQVTKRIHDSNL